MQRKVIIKRKAGEVLKEAGEQEKLRNYILGGIGDDENRSAIEERIMTDDDYFQQLTMVEEGLIQDYVDANLTAADRAKFEKSFLVSKENRQRVKFARALRRYVNENAPADVTEKKPSFFDSLRPFFSSPVPAVFAILIVLGFAGYLIWKSIYPSASNDSEVLIALNKAYRAERPIESRITGLDYAPVKNTRGANDENTAGKIERELAKSIALSAVSKNASAENLHALGRVYLSEKTFDNAVEQFEKAVALDPNNAKLRNDLGAALMEKAKLSNEEKLGILDRALKEFEKAAQINPALNEALFNKAVCLEIIPMPNQAKDAWNEYLKIDPSSRWSDEARQHLKRLDTQSQKEISDSEFEHKFFELYEKKNDEEIWRLINQNREMIKLKYLPQRLAMNFVNAPVEKRNNALEALVYLGKIEKERMGDSFASDLAEFYKNLPEEKIPLLQKAQISMKTGYKFCLTGELSDAVKEFIKAKQLFINAENYLESTAISQHFIAYCYYNTDRREEAIREFEQVKSFCDRNNYKWLRLATAYWITGWKSDSLDFHASRKAKQEYLAGLKTAEEIGDLYYIQRYLLTLASRSHKLRQEKEMLHYLQKLFSISNQSEISLRQKFRNFTTSFRMLISANFENLAKAVVLEELSLANESEEIFFITTAQIDVGTVQTQTSDFAEAERWFLQAKQTAETLGEKSQQTALLADIFLKSGNLERKKRDFQAAVRYYDESLKIVENQKAPTLLYELSKSRLVAYQELGNEAEVGNQIPAVIKIAEDYRAEILEENERNSFFDSEQNIYEIAVEHELRNGNHSRAFDYAEISNSRSLLDWLNKGIDKSDEKSEILLKQSTNPYTIEEIQKRMPPEVQILQYTVLEKKILLWSISKDKIDVISSEIPVQLLNEKINKYLSQIQSSNPDEQFQAKAAGRELYDILITPIISYLDKEKEICLIPNKGLFQLPFAALISPEGIFFLAQYSFFYSPSANVFILCTESAVAKQKLADEHLLAIGNPSFDRQEFAELQDLPDSEDEVKEISQFYQNPKILLKTEATKKSIQNSYRNFEIIHFAGHYIVQHNSPLSSGLVLAGDNDGGVLTNYELAGDSLRNTKVVVLSACQTGVESYYKGEGLVGLSRTFLASGVPLVIASQWKVDSDATATLMKDFHRYRRQEKLSSANALRQAQIEMLKNEKNGYSSPYYWAAFASFGGYARF